MCIVDSLGNDVNLRRALSVIVSPPLIVFVLVILTIITFIMALNKVDLGQA